MWGLREIRLVLALRKFEKEIKVKKLIPSLVTLGLTVIALFDPQIQDYVVGHPQVAAGLAGLYALLKGLMPSPVTPPQ